jgi:hypothetical protein
VGKMGPRGSIVTVISLFVLGFLLGILNTSALQAQGRRPDLEELHQRLLPLFELEGMVYTDADERTGRLVVGVANRGLETAIRARLGRLGVSSDQVDVVLAEPIVPVSTLTAYNRPVVGGLQIRWDNYICTFGFNGVRAGVEGFVVNSHCTTKQGGVNGTKYYQPINQTADEFIGTEIADPLYQRSIPGCPPGRVCRYSDSAFVQRGPGVLALKGFIAKTDTVNTGSLNVVADFEIVGEGKSYVDDVVNKVGRTTGWTQGQVTATCANTGVSGTKIVQLCQDFVKAGVGSGDSSSPVFSINPDGKTVQLRGILWGSGGEVFVYSPIANIEAELGPISTCSVGGC